MAIKKKSSGGGGANWMDTYGDMVTLLLCFFVLLYSMSTVSEDKWKALVQSFNPAGVVTQLEELAGGDGPSADEDQGGGVFDNPDAEEMTQEDIEDMLQELEQAISDMVAEEGLESVIQVEMQNGKVFISFSDSVFFLPDDFTLQPEGQNVLSKICPLLNEAEEAIDEIKIQGHTAQARANQPNETRGDYRLSFNRAVEVMIFLRDNSSIHPVRIIPEGMGQSRPVSSNKTAEGRAPNRRVEILISGVDLDAEALNEVIQNYISQSDEDLGVSRDQ